MKRHLQDEPYKKYASGKSMMKSILSITLRRTDQVATWQKRLP